MNNHKKINKDERNVYIDNIPVEEAIETYKRTLFSSIKTEKISIYEALFRTTSQAVYAKISSPHFHCAAMDGIAVRAEDTYGATEKMPKQLKEGDQFEYINTGNPMPENKDSVIMIEDIEELADGYVQIIAPSYPWQHIRPVGEDIVQGEMIIPSYHTVRPIDMGALLNGGVQEIEAFSKLKVGILPTGTEIVQDIKLLEKGKLIDSNSRMFEGLILEAGGIPTIYPPAIDEKELLKEAIIKGIKENDMLIINAGSSAGSKDYTVDIIREIGEVIIHGVALKPGKPTILGKVDNKSVIGIPGYPVSAYFAFKTFVQPLLDWYLGKKNTIKNIEATLSQRVVSSLKHKELVRVTLGEVDNKLIATPLNRGAGATMSLVRADGVLSIPRQSEGIESGQKVTIELIKSIEDISQKLLLIGSHDLILDIIADKMPLSSGHVGSLGGIMSMKRNECHIAPIHLIDEETGEYNLTYVKRYFPPGTMAIIEGVRRLQGLMVQKGNPKRINGFNDLAREDIQYVNRQRGAGTRQLLDYELKKQSLKADKIIGYNREMTTHMTVAVTIKSDGADTGLGIYSAAVAMDLDFIPVGYESYDFLVPIKYLEDERVVKFIEILKSQEFKDELNRIGGYELHSPGKITKVGDNNG